MNRTAFSDLLTLMQTRRSVRRFLTEPVPDELLKLILEAATWAPSAHNRQPWRFAVLQTEGARSRLAERMGEAFRHDLAGDGLSAEEVEARVSRSHARILEAPAAILLCLDATSGDAYPDETRRKAEYLMGAQSVALAGGHLLLAAHALGLAGVWMCAPLFAPEAARRALDLPDSWEPHGLILLGRPAGTPAERARAPVGEVSVFL